MPSEKKRKQSGEDNTNPKRIKFAEDSDNEDDDFDETLDPSVDIISDEAEVGIIEKVFVVNFMCHNKLEVKPCANVNFVIGRNGSGKSAILTAIIVGLGGKANVTHRGNSLKGFIKEGCSFCQICITLRNRGTDAYKQEVYGESILVERKLHRDGGSSYKLKNAKTEKIISTNKSELVNILDQFNIQIDNPVSVLTQDTSRSFLNASDSKDKYYFFLKATHLEQMSSDYQQIIEEKNLTENLLSRKKAVVKDLSGEVKSLEEKYKDMQRLEEMKAQVLQFKEQLAWAFVKDKQEYVEAVTNAFEEYENRIPALGKEIEEKQSQEDIINNDLKKKNEEVQLISGEAEQLANNKQSLQAITSEKKQKAKYAQQSVKRIQRELAKTESDKALLIKEINDLRNSAQKNYEEENQKKEEAIALKQEEINYLKSQLSTSNHHLSQINESIRKSKQNEDKVKKDLMESNKQIENLKSQITKLQATQRNSLLAYGNATKNIVQTIDQWHQQGKFHRKPIGPLGSLIKLKEKKWDMAVEKALKSTIEAYACHDSHDMLALKKIFKIHCKDRSPSIIVSQFGDRQYDVSRNKPQNYLAVMDVISISNHIVANTLIDQSQIESCLLFEDAKKAQQVIWQQNPPSKKGISIEAHEILGGRLSMYYPSDQKHARYLQTDVKHLIKSVENELIGVQREHKVLEEQHASINAEIRRDNDEVKKTKRKCWEEQSKINQTEMELQDLQNMAIEKPPDVADLEGEVQEHETKIGKLIENLDNAKQDFEKSNFELQKNEELLGKASDDLQTIIAKLDILANETENLKGSHEDMINQKAKAAIKLEKLKDSINGVLEKKKKAEEDYESTLSKARQYCEEVVVKMSTEKLQSKIVAADKRIEREEARRGNRDEITKKYEDMLKRYEETKNLIKEHVTFLRCLDKAITRRAKRFEKFQRSLTNRTSNSFNMFLSQRGYVGVMKIDHENETLKIQVNVENMKGASTKDSKSLSGGERSFSTICFIMALWEAMEAPFRCLDEFDVFMDMLNRRISMNMLLEIAKFQSHRQFILLTPQDMSHVASANRVQIFKLSDPERGQQTIPFQPTD